MLRCRPGISFSRSGPVVKSCKNQPSERAFLRARMIAWQAVAAEYS